MKALVNDATYSPYGAYELKAKYQRNFLMGTLITTGGVLLILGVFAAIAAMNKKDATVKMPAKIMTVAELPPPPTVQKQQPQFQQEKPKAPPKVGIPIAVADDEAVEEEVQLATQDELSDINTPDVTEDFGSGGIEVDTSSEYIPSVDEFVPVEVMPAMLTEPKPSYPRQAEAAGLEGTVWVAVLVGKDGAVQQSQVYKSSGVESLDNAALEDAKTQKFKPAIQNGQPVACWAKYKVVFKMN